MYQEGQNAYARVYAVYQGYSVRKKESGTATDPRLSNYTNLLVLGIDDGADAQNTQGKHADTILFLSLEHSSDTVRVINIPGLTEVPYPGGGEGRLSGLYALGGAPLMTRSVATLLGVPIQQYLTIDTQALSAFVDALGGVGIYVEDDMHYQDPQADLAIDIPKGYQHMDGDTAQKYLRYRGTDLGDAGRIYRQQRFLKALYEQVLSVSTLARLPQVLDVVKNHVQTSAEIFDSASLAQMARALTGKPLDVTLLPGSWRRGLWQADKAAVGEQIENLFPELAPPQESS